MAGDALDGLTVGVVGTGAMGRGIAQIAAAGGFTVQLYDANPAALADAVGFVGKMLARAAEKGQISSEDAAAATARLQPAGSLAELAGCGLVIEAIVEDLGVKQKLFAELEGIVPADAVLATNTSSLSVTSIAAACRAPQRVAGFHFFNPVPLMKIVEVIDGVLTDPAATALLDQVAKQMGHVPVRAQDTPGFLVNHAGRAFGTEALRILQEGVADYATVDRILKSLCGFRMGPFELYDLTGLDVSSAVMESIYGQYFHEARYRPSPLARQRVAAGLFGRKVGRGFYDYAEGAAAPPEQPVPTGRTMPVWVSPAESEGHAAVLALLAAVEAPIEVGNRPSEGALCIVTPLGDDATMAALDQKLDPKRTVAIDTAFGLDRRRVLMATPVTTTECREAAHTLFARDGVPVSMLRDSPGFVAQRVVAMIVNLACDIAQQRIATPRDIDLAISLGLGYPRGPLAWGDQLGPARVLQILERLHAFYGDPRYRPSPWLKRRARLGVSLTLTEA